MKKLVKDIGDLNNLTIRETKNFFVYDDGNLISNTFFIELKQENTGLWSYFATL